MTNLDKSDVLDGLFAVWDETDTVLAALADDQWQAQTPLPGWTVHDVTAHLIGTESMLQGAATPDADIDISTLKHVRNDVGVMNERWVRKLRGVSPADLLEKFRATTAQRREALSGMADADWNQITATPAGPDTYGRFMRVRDLRLLDASTRHSRRPSRDPPTRELDGPASRWRSTRWLPAWVSSSASSAARPTAPGWRIELTGPLQRHDQRVDRRPRPVVDRFRRRQEPTSTITLDGLLFTRLGRRSHDRQRSIRDVTSIYER